MQYCTEHYMYCKVDFVASLAENIPKKIRRTELRVVMITMIGNIAGELDGVIAMMIDLQIREKNDTESEIDTEGDIEVMTMTMMMIVIEKVIEEEKKGIIDLTEDDVRHYRMMRKNVREVDTAL